MRHLPTPDDDKYANNYPNKVRVVAFLVDWSLLTVGTGCSSCQRRWIWPRCHRLNQGRRMPNPRSGLSLLAVRQFEATDARSLTQLLRFLRAWAS